VREERGGAQDSERGMTRRELLRRAGVLAGVVGISQVPTAARAGELPERLGLAAGSEEDPLVMMQRELERALEKPVEARKWGMVIDLRKCAGCHSCTVSCISENKLPPGVIYRPVFIREEGTYPEPELRFTPRPCMQCEAPPCVPVCPVNATWKGADHVVVIDYDVCIGCRLCVGACPYGARAMDPGTNYTDATPAVQPYERQPSHEYGRHWDRTQQEAPCGKARKCHFCLHRVERGLLPMCVTTCICRATYFGDLAEAKSLVSQLASRPNRMILLEEKGTRPLVTYLV